MSQRTISTAEPAPGVEPSPSSEAVITGRDRSHARSDDLDLDRLQAGNGD